MEVTRETNNEASSANEEFIEMDTKEDSALMTDSEIQLELDVIQKWSESLNLKKKISKETLSKKPLSTPKIQSVVVIPESASIRPNVEACQSGLKTGREPKLPKRNKNRIGLTKNKANDSGNSSSTLITLLSKGRTPVRKNASKPTIQVDRNNGVTPVNGKRNRSAGTTPEANGTQPDKMAKLQGETNCKTPDGTPRHSLMDRRNLNLKVCASRRPLTSKELQNIKQFLIYQIEQALEHRSNFIPIFTEPCKIGQDGVYVYCADETCAQWIKHSANMGIPDISEKLVTLPHETPVLFDPTFVTVRVYTTIPTQKPKDKILEDLAQLNRDLNTERWQIKRIRPKGPKSSIAYIRMDKRSYDTITVRDDDGEKIINWILGPIVIKRETHKPGPKKPQVASAAKESKTEC